MLVKNLTAFYVSLYGGKSSTMKLSKRTVACLARDMAVGVYKKLVLKIEDGVISRSRSLHVFWTSIIPVIAGIDTLFSGTVRENLREDIADYGYFEPEFEAFFMCFMLDLKSNNKSVRICYDLYTNCENVTNQVINQDEFFAKNQVRSE